MPPSILVLFNQPVLLPEHPDSSSERDVLDTVANTVRVLEAAGFDVRQLGINYDPQPLLNEIRENRPDAVFNLFEGIATQTNTEISVAALLEWLAVPFTGSPSPSLCLCRDKIRTKHLLTAAGLHTPEFLVIDRLPVPAWTGDWPAIVKPAYQDASVGIEQESVVRTQEDLEERVRYVLGAYGPPVIVERFVVGREFHVNLIEEGSGETLHRPLIMLPLGEICFEHTDPEQWPIYSFTAKLDVESDEFHATPLKSGVVLPEKDNLRLYDIANKAFRLLMCQDYARLDVRMTADGTLYVLEVNPNPYLNSPATIEGLESIGLTHEWLIVTLALGAVARGGKRIPSDTIQIPVDVSTAMD